MLTVEFVKRNGSKESARFFSSKSAFDFYDFSRGGGRFVGGAVESDGSRVKDFGLLRGRSLKEAQKLLKG